ncbi:hypothetical protein LCGC14_1083000 [marine sediment metagenome]|uniref:Uncharacterized protein n=1 Tax=marine sediment metagenome TaxID=412755 RepID=A0A0F9PXX1_9ZZZZ
MGEEQKFLHCSKCGKRLIERLSNGMFVFKFGKSKGTQRIPVELQIYGSVKMSCIRGTCDHISIFIHFPPVITDPLQSDGPNSALQSEMNSP